MVGPAPTGIRIEDVLWLCKNVIDLRPIHPAMLYAIGLMTIWKHMGHHPVFKDGEGTVATSMSQFLKFSMAGGVRIGKGTALAANEVIPQHTTPPLPFGSQIPDKSDHQKEVEYENERVLAQAAKDRAIGKSDATEGASQRKKKKKTVPLSFTLSDSEVDGSNRSGFGTHHSTSPLNTIIPNEAELTTGVNSLLSRHSPRYQHFNPSDETTHNTRGETAHTHASGSNGRVSSSSGGSHRQAFPRRNRGGSGIGISLRGDMDLLMPFAHQRSWFELGRGALAQIDILRRYEALNEDYRELYESYRSCQDHKALQQVHLGCVGKEADLTEKLVAVEKERDNLLDRDREREDHIKQLEADLASKTYSLTEAEGVVNTLKGDLKSLTVNLGQAEIVRHNYVRQLLPTVFQRLLSSGEYKKSLTDVCNMAIAAGWSKGVKAACYEEEAEAFLATAVDYDPACKDTFMSEFDSFFNKSHPCVEKLA
ncbi:hypothetical protein Tco_0212576 [Tanacetum coccineum]